MKKGFTLIELLAVIVILAIIGIITIPLIGNVIEESRNKTALISTNGYIKTIENELIINSKQDGEYKIADLNVQINGEKAKYGYISIKDDEIIKAKFCIGKVSTEYDGKEVIISKNNYCSEDYEITLIINGTKESKKIGTKNETEFVLSDISTMTNVSCNNGIVPTIENNTLKINNIYGDATCVINDTLNKTLDGLDNTENNIVMLNDEEFNSKKVVIDKLQTLTIDLNGKSIVNNQTADEPFIINYGNLTINDSIGTGSIFATYRVISNRNKLIINNGKFSRKYSDSNAGAVVGTGDNGKTIINGGTFIGDNVWTLYVSGNNSYLIINGGYIETETNRAINVCEAGNLEINGGIIVVVKSGTGIRFSKDATGLCIINNVDVTSNKGVAIYNDSTKTININGGKYISSNSGPTIFNASSGDIKITDQNARVYIKNEISAVKENETEWYYSGIKNVSSGNIYINGNDYVDNCSVYNENLSGICLTSYYRTLLNENNATGNIFINKAYIYSENHYAVSNYTGVSYINNSTIKSNSMTRASLSNMSGTVNICNSIFKGYYDIYNNGGNINYNTNTIFINNTNNPTVNYNKGTLVSNYNGVCVY